MLDDDNQSRRASLVAGLILLIVLAAVAAMSGTPGEENFAWAVTGNPAPYTEVFEVMSQLGAGDNRVWFQGSTVASQVSGGRTRSPGRGRVAPNAHGRALAQILDALEPIGVPMSACFADEALVTYDLGVAPGAAVEVLAGLLESADPDLHARLRGVLRDFRFATGLDPAVDLLPHLGQGISAALLPPEDDPDGWPLPRKVVIMRVHDEEAVARFLEGWITWVAGAVAPMTHGVLGAWIDSETVAGFDLVGLRLDGVLPARLPLPSPSYGVAEGFLIVSPVRSAAAETLNRFAQGCSSPPARDPDESVVEEVWLNLPEWPAAWQRAEPLVGSTLAWLGVESPAAVPTLRSLFQLLGGFRPAHGTTSLTQNGGLVFSIELELVEAPDRW
jgi:hypothetical protein